MSTAEPPDESRPPDPAPTPATPPEATVDDPPAPPVVPTVPEPETPAPAPGDTWSALTAAAATTPPPPSDVIPAVPEAWSAPAPKAKRKLTWLWVLMGVLGLIAALVVVAVVLWVRMLAGPIDATNKVLAQVKAEDYATAYRVGCSQNREDYTEAQYAQVFIDTTTQRGVITSYDANYSSVHGSNADVRYNIDFKGGSSLRLEARAVKEAGRWRACLLPKKRKAVSP